MAGSAFVSLTAFERGAAGALFVLVALVCAVLSYSGGDPGMVPVYLALLIYLGALAVPLLLYRPDWGLFHPLLFAVLWWGLMREVLPRLGLYGSGLEQHRALLGWGRAELNALVVESLLLETLALLSMYFGFLAAPRMRRASFSVQTGRPRWIGAKMLLLAAVSGIALIRLIREAGGLGALLLQRGLAADETVLAQLGGHWAFLVGVLQTGCLVWLALRPAVWRSPLFLGFFAAGLFMTFAATGSRGAVLVPMLAALAIWCLHYRRIPYGALAVAAFAAIAAVGILGEFRTETRGAKSFDEVQVEGGVAAGLEKGLEVIGSRAEEIAGIYGVLGKVPHSVDLLLGESYLSVLAIPVPRALWPGKPDAAGRINAIRVFSEPLNAIPPGNMGEAYWNFHLPGVVLVFMAWGMFLKWLAVLYRDQPRNVAVLVFFALTLFYLQPNSVAVYKWLQAVVPATAILAFLCGLRLRRGGAFIHGAEAPART